MDSKVDERVVQKDTVSFQEVTSVTCNLLASFWIIASKGFQDFMMVESTSFISDLNVWDLAPSFNDEVIIFVIVDWDGVMDDVTDFVDFDIDSFE